MPRQASSQATSSWEEKTRRAFHDDSMCVVAGHYLDTSNHSLLRNNLFDTPAFGSVMTGSVRVRATLVLMHRRTHAAQRVPPRSKYQPQSYNFPILS